jgi:nucleotide-binding universal stress UspA family protein
MAERANGLSKNVSGRKGRGKNWVMAVDPFAGFDLNPILRFAKHTADQAGATLDIVYILAPAGLNWTGEFSGPWIKRYKPIAEEKLNEVVGELDVKRKVLTCKEAGQREAVKTLLTFAKKIHADCIFISTHARRGLERMAMGSFAESLVLSSKIPVMVMNPQRDIPEEVHKILVPTDLEKYSARFVAKVADYALQFGAEIVLYYKQPDPLDPIVQQGVYTLGGGWISVQSFVVEELQRKTKLIEKLELMLRKRGVQVSHILDSTPGDLIESIDKAAHDTGADLVSLRTEAGKWTATLLGSVARGLVRQSSVPVLVQR